MNKGQPDNSTVNETPSIALIGNPNTGKSTLFGSLVGVRQRVANYPGVTVEKRSGRIELDGKSYEALDLPGLYSLAARSEDEAIAVRTLLGRLDGSPRPAAVLCIVDASNPRRNFYLVSQLLELGIPTVVALNMIDVAEREGVSIDIARLSRRLGVPVVPVQASKGLGVEGVRRRLVEVMQAPRGQASAKKHKCRPDCAAEKGRFPEAFEEQVERIAQQLPKHATNGETTNDLTAEQRFLGRRLLLDVAGGFERLCCQEEVGDDIDREIADARTVLAERNIAIPGVETETRYAWVDALLEGVVSHRDRSTISMTDRLDHVLTHRVIGLILFGLLMIAVFQAVFTLSDPLTGWIEQGMGFVEGLVRNGLAAIGMSGGAIEGLLCDGLIGGVGGVLGFLPQIMLLFVFIAVLEDCGYMARAAFLMDRIMSRVGLCGKAFLPLLSCYACAVPGIMATRVIENPRDRLITIFVAPFMTCSARIPVFVMLTSAFIPATVLWKVGGFSLITLPTIVLFSMYLVGLVAAITTALLLKKSVLKSSLPCFVMELPSYKTPSPMVVAHRVAERGWRFIRDAGTIICVASVLVWAAIYFPHDEAAVDASPDVVAAAKLLDETSEGSEEHALAEAEWERTRAAAFQRNSLLGRVGRAIEPIFKPAGWDWRIGCSVLASFPAREIVVAAFGVSFNAGEVDPGDEASAQGLKARLAAATWPETGKPLFNIPVALSLMVFCTLCAQCSATLAAMRRETNSWRWPVFSFVYMTVLAYVMAVATYQTGMWLGG